MKIDIQYAGFLNSKSLWNEDSISLPKFDLFNKKINAPEKTAITISENEVLGKRIEHFFEYYIISQNRYDIIIKNLQIFKSKITIGELDFLIKDRISDQIIHVELVYKFYLYVPEVSAVELEKWIGPNRKDSLPEKVKKLKQKQLPLLYRDETTIALDKLNLKPKEIKQQVCFLATLFIPVSYKGKTIPIVNNECIAGYWIHQKDFLPQKYMSYHFSIPQKQDWVSNPSSSRDWLPYEQISQIVLAMHIQKKSPLLWLKDKEDSFSTLFVVWW